MSSARISRTGFPSETSRRKTFVCLTTGKRSGLPHLTPGRSSTRVPLLFGWWCSATKPESLEPRQTLWERNRAFGLHLISWKTTTRWGVAHSCDNGDTQLDLLPTEDRDSPIRVLAETLNPIPFQGGSEATDETSPA